MLESGVRDTMTDIAAIWAGERIKKKTQTKQITINEWSWNGTTIEHIDTQAKDEE